MKTITIVGCEVDGHCEHCGRALKHCIRLSDGRIVGAICLDKKLTAPKVYQGKKYRLGADLIIRAAKCAQFIPAHKWSGYGVSPSTMSFDLV